MVVVGVKTMIRLAARAGGTGLLGLKRRLQSVPRCFCLGDFRKLSVEQGSKVRTYH